MCLLILKNGKSAEENTSLEINDVGIYIFINIYNSKSLVIFFKKNH